jgi:hypothetical protein
VEQFCFQSSRQFDIHQVKGTDVPVKEVRISSCTTTFRFRFPILALIVRERSQLQAPTAKSARWKTTQIGRERPHFFGFHPPKKFLGSLPPVSLHQQNKLKPSETTRVNLYSGTNRPRIATRMSLVSRPAWQAHRKEKHRNANLENTTETHSQRNHSSSS